MRHLASEHHHNPIGHGERLSLVVRHVDGGDANATLKFPNEITHLVAKSGVQVGQRLIEQQYPRLNDQRASQGDPLLLSTRQLARVPLAETDQLNRVHGLGHTPCDLRPRCVAHLQAKRQVLCHRQVGEQGVVLEHHANVAFFSGQLADVLAIELDGAGVGHLETGHQFERGGLATA